MRFHVMTAAALAALFTNCPAPSADPLEEIEAAMASIGTARAQLAAAEKQGGRGAARAAALAAYEEALAALREGLRAGSRERDALRARIQAEERRAGRVIPVLEILGRLPKEGRLSHPGGPAAAVRSEIILASVLSGLKTRTARLRSRLDKISLLAATQEQAVAVLRAGMLATARNRESPGADAKAGAAAPDPETTAAALRQGSDALAALARLISASPPGQETAAAKSGAKLPLPVAGRLRRAFFTEDAGGHRRPGIVLAAEPGASVTSPALATVRFAGAFSGYGQVVVLEIRADSLIVLAGLAVALVTEGEIVQAGEIVGLLGGGEASDEEKLIAAPKGTGSKPEETLYIEARLNGEPVDPADWLDLPVQ
ncbi:MAG: murein hydrolase activator EnvC family protein [Paracoccaceae bacterium]